MDTQANHWGAEAREAYRKAPARQIPALLVRGRLRQNHAPLPVELAAPLEPIDGDACADAHCAVRLKRMDARRRRSRKRVRLLGHQLARRVAPKVFAHRLLDALLEGPRPERRIAPARADHAVGVVPAHSAPLAPTRQHVRHHAWRRRAPQPEGVRRPVGARVRPCGRARLCAACAAARAAHPRNVRLLGCMWCCGSRLQEPSSFQCMSCHHRITICA